MGNNPSLTEIRSEILRYATFEQEIDELKPIIIVGALELHTGNCNYLLCSISMFPHEKFYLASSVTLLWYNIIIIIIIFILL